MNNGALMYILLLLNQNKCCNQCELQDITVEELIILLALCVPLFFIINYLVKKLLGE